MTFTSATKTLTYYIDTPGTQRLVEACGSRLTEMTQREKYQLAGTIGEYLATMVKDPENGELDEDETWTLLDHISQNNHCLTNNVKALLVILRDEKCESLAALLPAIAEYARDDN